MSQTNAPRPGRLRSAPDITASNAISSSLLRLPGKLRNKIYDHVFAYISPSYGRHKRHTGATAFALHTCRQLLHETSTLLNLDFRPYRTDHFEKRLPVEHFGSQICAEAKKITIRASTMDYIADAYLWDKDAQPQVVYMRALQIVYVWLNMGIFSMEALEGGLQKFFGKPELQIHYVEED